jgi:hypothetical protein
MLAKTAMTSAVISSDPPREEYVEAFFADRDEEIKIIERKIAQAQVGKIERPILEVYAVKGQGKSWFLQRIFDHFLTGKKESTHVESSKPPLTAYVDFEKLVEKPGSHPSSILRTLALALQEQSKRSSEVYSPDTTRTPTGKRLGRTATEFTQFVQSLTDHYVPILIFDSTDRADEKVLEWLEDHVVFPLIHGDQVIFIFGGRRRLFWKYFEVRRRVDAHELLPLDIEGSAEQFELRKQDPEIGKLLFHFSKGHPEINWTILYALQYERGISKLDKATIEKNHSYILDRIREIVDLQFLVGLSKEAYTLLWDVCVLRKFHTAQLRYFAAMRKERNRNRPEGDYLDLIQQMEDVTLVHWDSDIGGYVLDKTVRDVMLEYRREREREQSMSLEHAAIEMYKNWIKEYPDNRSRYLVEIVYHKGFLLDSHELD